jgi:sugar phosphate isomerase/epimerase
MNRRDFIFKSSGFVLTASVLPSLTFAALDKTDRLGMGTVLFRYRFKQTKPPELPKLENELTLLDVPAYYKKRFNIRNLEFWSYHFESLDRDYLQRIKDKVKEAGSQVINVQIDTNYNLASTDEAERQRSLEHVFGWIDAVSFLGSTAIRVNPGHNGSVEKSIASMREVNHRCKSKGLPLLIENHFGIEMDPEVHLRIRREAGPDNVYTLPDFGNYPVATMWESLEKILPYAYLISAKVMDFNDRWEHVSYDFDRCVKISEQAGFKGIYSVEQWSRKFANIDYEKVADWMLDHIRANI